MPSGPRPASRPGAGPGRGKPRARSAPRPPAAKPPTSPAPGSAPAEPLVEQPAVGRRRSSLTTRAIVLAVVLLVLTISYASSLRIYFAQAQEIAATTEEIATREQRIVDLQGDLARWNDPAYVKLQARSRLGWVVPGETGYKVVGTDGEPLGGSAEINPEAAPGSSPQDAWWARLWGSVEAADQPAPVATSPTTPNAEPTISERTAPKDPERTPR